MPRKPKNYAQLTSDVEELEAKLKSLKELQAKARKEEQSKLAERIGRIVIKSYPKIDFISMSDKDIQEMLLKGQFSSAEDTANVSGFTPNVNSNVMPVGADVIDPDVPEV